MLKPNKIGKAQTSFALAAKDVVGPNEAHIAPYSTSNANSRHVTFSFPQPQIQDTFSTLQLKSPQNSDNAIHKKELLSKLEQMEKTIAKLMPKKNKPPYQIPSIQMPTEQKEEISTIPHKQNHNRYILHHQRIKHPYQTLSKERLIGINEYLSDQAKKDEILKEIGVTPTNAMKILKPISTDDDDIIISTSKPIINHRRGYSLLYIIKNIALLVKLRLYYKSLKFIAKDKLLAQFPLNYKVAEEIAMSWLMDAIRPLIHSVYP